MTRQATTAWPGTAEIRSAYDLLAAHYIASTWEFERFPGLREELIEFFGLLPDGPVLDIGCGAGRDAALAGSLGRPVVLADISFELLTMTAARLRPAAAVCSDAVALPFRDRAFAGVVASGVLLHLPKAYLPAALDEMRRVLMSGGFAVISMKHGGTDGWRATSDFPLPRWFTYFSPDEFANLCGDSGFAVHGAERSARKDWFTVTVRRP